ncbi:unnamed protein product [Durusdinium trenchii]|uniref:Uncharacterized protein n=1 Tax=Durusdinium trenchii TaxID=1381693 RepID=A0ABP0HX62_9DINO
MKIFVDTDDDVRLARRIRRDTVERGRDVEAVIKQYTRFVKPSFEKYILPSRNNADIVIPWRENNAVATDLITQHIRTKLGMHELLRIFTNLYIMPATMQTRGMHTKIRSRDTCRQEFVFYADRLIRLVVEAALGHLPFLETEVLTPVGEPYQGVEFSRRICGVSIIRSGEAMENALRTCCIGVKIGKILIDQVGKERPKEFKTGDRDLCFPLLLQTRRFCRSIGYPRLAIWTRKNPSVKSQVCEGQEGSESIENPSGPTGRISICFR